jgi:hypothetical protein
MMSEKLTRAEISRRYRERHPEKMKEAQKKYRDANKQYMSERQRKYQLRDKYGITDEDYNNMFISQDGKCAICGTSDQTGKWQRFGVDHCHKTGKVRALLCNECNRGMGLLKDNAELLRKAADYLDSHKVVTKQENEERKDDRTKTN